MDIILLKYIIYIYFKKSITSKDLMKNSLANTRGRSPTLRQYMKESVQIKKRKNSVGS